MPLSNAERQSRYRQRRAQGVPVIRLVERKGRALSRPAQWAAAVGRLRHLQAEYEAWLEQLPEPLHDTATGKRLAQVCALDLDALDIEVPREVRARLTHVDVILAKMERPAGGHPQPTTAG